MWSSNLVPIHSLHVSVLFGLFESRVYILMRNSGLSEETTGSEIWC